MLIRALQDIGVVEQEGREKFLHVGNDYAEAMEWIFSGSFGPFSFEYTAAHLKIDVDRFREWVREQMQ